MKRLWRKLEQLRIKGYPETADGSPDLHAWDKAFELLMEVIKEGRSQDAAYGSELHLLDEATNCRYDLERWLDDYLEALLAYGRNAELEAACRRVLDIFRWESASPSHFRFLLSLAIGRQGRMADTVEFCRQWNKEDPEDMVGAASLIYAQIETKDLKGAEETVMNYLSEDTVCTAGNHILFIAAAAVYRATGDKLLERKYNVAVSELEKELQRQIYGLDV